MVTINGRTKFLRLSTEKNRAPMLPWVDIYRLWGVRPGDCISYG